MVSLHRRTLANALLVCVALLQCVSAGRHTEYYERLGVDAGANDKQLKKVVTALPTVLG